MPYKDKEKRRTAWRKWAAFSRKKYKAKRRARKLALAAYPKVQPCEICGGVGERHHDDHSKPLEIRWLCRSHHEAAHHIKVRRCKVRGCNKKHHAYGYCNSHGHQWRRNTL